MDFTIEPATPADAEELTELFFKCFTGELNDRMFPATPDVREWWIKTFTGFAEEAQSTGTTSFLKVVATPNTPTEDTRPVIAAYARWVIPRKPGAAKDDGHSIVWPAGSDSALCDEFFLGMAAEKEQAVGDQPHYYLDMLGTHPEFNRRGLGSKLLKWGTTRADEEGVLTYLSSSPSGRPLYERNGFQVVREYEVVSVPGYFQTTMLRPAM